MISNRDIGTTVEALNRDPGSIVYLNTWRLLHPTGSTLTTLVVEHFILQIVPHSFDCLFRQFISFFFGKWKWLNLEFHHIHLDHMMNCVQDQYLQENSKWTEPRNWNCKYVSLERELVILWNCELPKNWTGVWNWTWTERMLPKTLDFWLQEIVKTGNVRNDKWIKLSERHGFLSLFYAAVGWKIFLWPSQIKLASSVPNISFNRDQTGHEFKFM